ncbi:unnamed protein product [Calypogeia fissa]
MEGSEGEKSAMGGELTYRGSKECRRQACSDHCRRTHHGKVKTRGLRSAGKWQQCPSLVEGPRKNSKYGGKERERLNSSGAERDHRAPGVTGPLPCFILGDMPDEDFLWASLVVPAAYWA